jgi:pSer/pThr/pTyr-binding forkhead associated (FHA) protein
MNAPATLVFDGGSQPGHLIPLQPFFLIGRHPRCHLRPTSPEVSRHHCALFIEDERILVRDLRSRTGTRVNGQPIRGEVELQAGDQLCIGPLVFVLSLKGRKDPLARDTDRSSASPTRLDIELDEMAAAQVLLTDHPDPCPAAQEINAEPFPPSAITARAKSASKEAAVEAEAILRKYRYRPDARPE